MFLVRHGQSEFNKHFSATGIDPGIRDPALTDLGREQAKIAGEVLIGRGVEHLWCSPYRRAIETASIIADVLGLPISRIEPMVGERAAYFCDYGSAPTVLSGHFPHLDFSHLADQWWPDHEEPLAGIQARSVAFRSATDGHPSRDRLAIVSHWGFINALTGLPVPNCAIVHYRLTPDPVAEVVHGE
ncbi:histidine phosphatase family protein [Lacibacterium aquatile]|uniref:Histidine phosphatase family protein n=1 Tax=Lacibacterium aquatile TaxID=1168082 RepID=A0ABW5DXW7_9PROT